MRKVVAILVFVLIIGIAGSWWLGWWSLSTDQGKMKQDVDSAKNKIKSSI